MYIAARPHVPWIYSRLTPSLFSPRVEDGRYKAFTEEITAFIPAERQYTDAVRTFAYGTDASFYR